MTNNIFARIHGCEQVKELAGGFTDPAIPAIAVFVGDSALSQSQLADIEAGVEAVGDIEAVESEVSPPIPSDDELAVQAFIPINADADTSSAVSQVGDKLRSDTSDNVTVYITGPAGFNADLTAAFAGIDSLLLAVALAAVLVILVLVYRSYLLPIAVLSTSLFALCGALLTVWWLAKWEIVLLSGQTQGILFILVNGAATDYSLLLVARYREELRVNPDNG